MKDKERGYAIKAMLSDGEDLKGVRHEIFDFRFFTVQFSPRP
jgi:hypothetical protein